MTYNTKQKDIIYKAICNKHNEFTIKDIYNELKDETGLTTIYRVVDKMLEENTLSKRIDNDNNTYYHYLEKCDKENHFYLKCDNCGEMIHVDCDCIDELSSHIVNEHKFRLSKEHIIINGLCSKCSKEM